jgi:hypothetical protein
MAKQLRERFNDDVLDLALARSQLGVRIETFTTGAPVRLSLSRIAPLSVYEANPGSGGNRNPEHLSSLSRLSRFCTQVCLSTPLGWAWLQGNSRARCLHSAIPGLAGFGLPPRLRASPFANSQTICFRILRKTGFAWLESGPFCSGRPNRSGHERKTNKCFAKVASLSSVSPARKLRPALRLMAIITLASRSQRAWSRAAVKPPTSSDSDIGVHGITGSPLRQNIG